MAKYILRSELGLDNRRAKQAAKDATREVDKFGNVVKKGTQDGTKGMTALGKATAGFGQQIVALGASYLSLQGLQAAISAIITGYNRALELRRELAGTAMGVQRGLAGAAAQFNISEAAMAEIVGRLAVAGGAGPQDWNAIGQMITGAASAQLIGQITEPRPGVGRAAPQDFQKLTTMVRFGGYTGAPGAGPQFAKLFQKGLPPNATPQQLSAVAGKTMTAYRASQMSDWNEYIQGAISLSTLLEQGVSYERGVSWYSALAKMAKSGRLAGELIRLIGDKFFTADDPGVISMIDRKYGAGSYWDMKKNDPDTLLGEIIATLVGPEGPERKQLYDKLGIPVEQRGRLAQLKAVVPLQKEIMGAMGAVSPGMAAKELTTWRAGQRAVAQAGASKAKQRVVAAGTGKGIGFAEALREVAGAELKLWEREDPWGYGIESLLSTDRQMLNIGIRRAAAREGVTPYETMGIDITGDRVEVGPNRREEVLGILRGLGGSPVNVSVINMPPPQNRATGLRTKTDVVIGGQ